MFGRYLYRSMRHLHNPSCLKTDIVLSGIKHMKRVARRISIFQR